MMNLNTKHAGKLFILSGPSGAGKGTICKELLAQTDLELSVSMTTRAPREGEIHGVHYYFVNEDEFVDRINNDGFLEHAQVYGRRYGTPKEPVIDKLKQGIDVILEIDIQGALKVKENYPDGVFIFILPPSMAELRKRLTGRGTETAEAIEMRLGETLKRSSAPFTATPPYRKPCAKPSSRRKSVPFICQTESKNRRIQLCP